jgi:hypothetical protein
VDTGYLGIGHLNYFPNPETWFQANLKIMQEFPEGTFLPSWRVEYGIDPFLGWLHATWRYTATALKTANPRRRPTIPVATREAAFARRFAHDVNNLLVAMMEDPAAVHRLLAYTTGAIIQWLKVQADVIGPSVECIFVLDDIVGSSRATSTRSSPSRTYSRSAAHFRRNGSVANQIPNHVEYLELSAQPEFNDAFVKAPVISRHLNNPVIQRAFAKGGARFRLLCPAIYSLALEVLRGVHTKNFAASRDRDRRNPYNMGRGAARYCQTTHRNRARSLRPGNRTDLPPSASEPSI